MTYFRLSGSRLRACSLNFTGESQQCPGTAQLAQAGDLPWKVSLRKSVIRQRLEQAGGASMPSAKKRGKNSSRARERIEGFLNTRGHVSMGSLSCGDGR